MSEPIRVSVYFDTQNSMSLRRAADDMDALSRQVQRVSSSAGGLGRAARIITDDLNRMAATSHRAFQPLIVGMGSMVSSLQSTVGSLLRLGFYKVVAEMGLVAYASQRMFHEFVKVNEQFAGLEITLQSAFRSVRVARQLREELVRITARSPVPFTELAEAARAVAVIPQLSALISRQVTAIPQARYAPGAARPLTDQQGFFNRWMDLVAQMMTFRPDKQVKDVVFAVREAATGELRSLIRRFDFPPSLLAMASGRSLTDLKRDPAGMVYAIEAAMSRVITPEAVQAIIYLPSKLADNLKEQLLQIPLLRIGEAGFFKSMTAYFGNFYDRSVSIVSKLFGPKNGEASPLSQSISDSLTKAFSSFTRTVDALVETVLDKSGFGAGSRIGSSQIERIFLAFSRGAEYVSEELPKLGYAISEFAEKHLSLLLKGLEMLAKAVVSVAEFFVKHPYLSLAAYTGYRMLPQMVPAAAGLMANQFAYGGQNLKTSLAKQALFIPPPGAPTYGNTWQGGSSASGYLSAASMSPFAGPAGVFNLSNRMAQAAAYQSYWGRYKNVYNSNFAALQNLPGVTSIGMVSDSVSFRIPGYRPGGGAPSSFTLTPNMGVPTSLPPFVRSYLKAYGVSNMPVPPGPPAATMYAPTGRMNLGNAFTYARMRGVWDDPITGRWLTGGLSDRIGAGAGMLSMRMGLGAAGATNVATSVAGLLGSVINPMALLMMGSAAVGSFLAWGADYLEKRRQKQALDMLSGQGLGTRDEREQIARDSRALFELAGQYVQRTAEMRASGNSIYGFDSMSPEERSSALNQMEIVRRMYGGIGSPDESVNIAALKANPLYKNVYAPGSVYISAPSKVVGRTFAGYGSPTPSDRTGTLSDLLNVTAGLKSDMAKVAKIMADEYGESIVKFASLPGTTFEVSKITADEWNKWLDAFKTQIEKNMKLVTERMPMIMAQTGLSFSPDTTPDQNYSALEFRNTFASMLQGKGTISAISQAWPELARIKERSSAYGDPEATTRVTELLTSERASILEKYPMSDVNLSSFERELTRIQELKDDLFRLESMDLFQGAETIRKKLDELIEKNRTNSALGTPEQRDVLFKQLQDYSTSSETLGSAVSSSVQAAILNTQSSLGKDVPDKTLMTLLNVRNALDEASAATAYVDAADLKESLGERLRPWLEIMKSLMDVTEEGKAALPAFEKQAETLLSSLDDIVDMGDDPAMQSAARYSVLKARETILNNLLKLIQQATGSVSPLLGEGATGTNLPSEARLLLYPAFKDTERQRRLLANADLRRLNNESEQSFRNLLSGSYGSPQEFDALAEGAQRFSAALGLLSNTFDGMGNRVSGTVYNSAQAFGQLAEQERLTLNIQEQLNRSVSELDLTDAANQSKLVRFNEVLRWTNKELGQLNKQMEQMKLSLQSANFNAILGGGANLNAYSGTILSNRIPGFAAYAKGMGLEAPMNPGVFASTRYATGQVAQLQALESMNVSLARQAGEKATTQPDRADFWKEQQNAFLEYASRYRETLNELQGLNNSYFDSARDGFLKVTLAWKANMKDLSGISGQLTNSTVNGLSDAFASLIMREKSAEQALRDFSKALLREALQMMLNKAIQSLLGAIGGAIGGAASTGFSSAGSGYSGSGMTGLQSRSGGSDFRFAEGGLVTGGVPGKDSVLALLTPGEFVIPANTVSRYGTGHFESYRTASNGASVPADGVPRFASGGLVVAPVGGARSVNSQVNVVVNVARDGTATAETESRQSDERSAAELASAIEVAVNGAIAKQMRQGGILKSNSR